MSFWGNLGSTIVTGLLLSELSKNQGGAGGDSEEPDYGVREQSAVDTGQKVPIVYGTAFLGGKMFDMTMVNGNRTMYYALALSEVTGNTELGSGPASSFVFKDIYWNGNRIVFYADGVTAAYMVDDNGVVDKSIDGLIKIYCYADGSLNGVVPENYTASIPNAYDIMPAWTSAHTADDLVFMIIKVNYNREKGITGIGDVLVHLENSMNQPGDCIYDYMTNTRYGAGIDPTNILST